MDYFPMEDWMALKIRRRSVRNVEDGRLLARLEGLRIVLSDGRWAEQKCEFKHRVVEAIQIEDELGRRAVDYRPVTRRTV